MTTSLRLSQDLLALARALLEASPESDNLLLRGSPDGIWINPPAFEKSDERIERRIAEKALKLNSHPDDEERTWDELVHPGVDDQRSHTLEDTASADAVALSDYPEGFKLEELKGLKPTQAIKYAQQHLQKLGKGSARVAFVVDAHKALKVALNDKGLAQNSVEADVANLYDCVTKVFDADHDAYTWIEVERARKAVAGDFKRLAHMGWDLFTASLRYLYGERSGLHYWGKPVGFDTENELLNSVTDMMVNYSMPVGDLTRKSSWGVVSRSDGEHLVLVDFGLTKDVFKQHYMKPPPGDRFRSY